MNWESGIDMYTLICIKWITTKKKLQKFKNSKKKFKKNNHIVNIVLAQVCCTVGAVN